MRNVAQVLVDRSKFIRRQRKKYATAAPRGYVCQDKDVSPASSEMSDAEDEDQNEDEDEEDDDDESDFLDNESDLDDAVTTPSENEMSEREEISDGEMEGGKGEEHGSDIGKDDEIPDRDETVWQTTSVRGQTGNSSGGDSEVAAEGDINNGIRGGGPLSPCTFALCAYRDRI